MTKVSIIIPVYNTDKYLSKCLDSVIGQTLKEIEIICIDDGSTDTCSQILDVYAQKDGRIKVIHKKNGGLVSARKEGVKIADGEYIGYVDSDDWIEPDMYEKLYKKITEYNADLVSSGYIYEGDYITYNYDSLDEGIYENEGISYLRAHSIYQLEKKELGLRGSLCCKLFRASILKRVQCLIPNNITASEDKACLITYMLECDSAYILKEAYYHYIIHKGSMVHKANTEYLTSVNNVYQYFLTLYDHPKFTPNMRTQAELYITEMLIHGINTRLGFANRNMLWLDPYWLDRLPSGAGIVLYGAGELGEKYRQQLCSRSDLKYIGCMDYGYEKHSESRLNVQSPSNFAQTDYNYIVITIKNKRKADEVRQQLIKEGIKAEKIQWFEQKEIYWKFAEAEGLLKLGKVQDET